MFFNKKTTKPIRNMLDDCYPDCQHLPAQQLLLEKDITKHGWMFKKTGRTNKINFTQLSNYDKRFFVLFNGWVYYYKDEQSSEPQKYFSLQGYSSRVHPAVEEKITALPFMFKLYHEYPNHRTYYFAPDTSEEMGDWIRCFKNDIERFNYKAVPKQRASKSLPETKRNYYPGPQTRPFSSFNNSEQSSNSDSAGNSVTSSQSVSTLGSVGSVAEAVYDPVSPEFDNYNSDPFEQGKYEQLNDQQQKGFTSSSPIHRIQLAPPFQFRLPVSPPDRLKPQPPPASKKPTSPLKEVSIFSPPPTLPLLPRRIQSDEDDRIYCVIDDVSEMRQYPPRPQIQRLSSLPQVPPPLPPDQMDDEYELPNTHLQKVPISPSSTAGEPPPRPPKPPTMCPTDTAETYFDVANVQDMFTHNYYDTPPDENLGNVALYDDSIVEPTLKTNNPHVDQTFTMNLSNRMKEVHSKPNLPNKPLPVKNKHAVPFNKPPTVMNISSGVNTVTNEARIFGNPNVRRDLKPANTDQVLTQLWNPESQISAVKQDLKKTTLSTVPKPDNHTNKPSWCLPNSTGEKTRPKPDIHTNKPSWCLLNTTDEKTIPKPDNHTNKPSWCMSNTTGEKTRPKPDIHTNKPSWCLPNTTDEKTIPKPDNHTNKPSWCLPNSTGEKTRPKPDIHTNKPSWCMSNTTGEKARPKPDNHTIKPSWCLQNTTGDNSDFNTKFNTPLKPPVKNKPATSPKPPTAIKPTLKPKPYR